MFAFIPLFVDFVRYLTFWHHMIQIYLTQKVCWLFCMFYMSLWNTWDIISPIEGIWLDVPLTRLLFIFLCSREKDNLCSLLGSTSACCCAFRGRSAGSFPEPMGNATHQFGSGIATLFTSLLMYTFLFFSINTDQQGISSDRVNTRVNFVLIK